MRQNRRGLPKPASICYENSKIYPHGKPPAPLGLTSEDWARQSREPVLLHTAHSAGMQMTFYTGTMLPAEYKNDAFICLRGSWNRNPPSGYEVARIRFDQSGKPVRIEPFLSGFPSEADRPTARTPTSPASPELRKHRDGSLFVSDDTNNIIYRVTYNANAPLTSARHHVARECLDAAARNRCGTRQDHRHLFRVPQRCGDP